jgi:hypothetical protein
MALASTAAVSQSLNGLDATGSPVNLLAFAALFSATPGTTGASNEMVGGSYARQAASWTSSTGGSAKTNTAAITWSTTGATAVTHFGTFSAVTAGTFGIGGALGSSVTAASITAATGALSIGAS